MGEIGGDDQSDGNSLRSATALSWKSGRSSEILCRNAVASKDQDSSTRRAAGASRRTRRRDSPSAAGDLSAFMSSQFFFQCHAAAGDSFAGSESPNNEEANKHGRMMEWLEMQVPSSPDSSVERSSAQSVAIASPSYLPRRSVRIRRPPLDNNAQDTVPVATTSSPNLPRPRTPLYSNSPSPLNPSSFTPQSSPLERPPTHRSSPSYRCSLPCQSCGNTHEPMSQDRSSSALHSTNGDVPAVMYKRNDRLSKSARHPEMAVDALPASSGVKKEPSPAVATYSKFDGCSKSARHPEMVANLSLSGCLDKGGDLPLHNRSTSVDMSRADNRSQRVDQESNFRKETVPRMMHSATCREQTGLLKSKHGRNNFESKSPAAAVQHWLSQILHKAPKAGPKIGPVKAGVPVYQDKIKGVVEEGTWISRNRSGTRHGGGTTKPQPEQQVIGTTTLNDILNTKGVMWTETKVVSVAPQKGDQRSNASNENSQGTFSMPLPRSSSVHSDQLFYRAPVEDSASVPSCACVQTSSSGNLSEDGASRNQFRAPVSLNGNGTKPHPKLNSGMLSPPKRRKEAARRLEMLVKENERLNSHSNSSANSSPPSSIQRHLEVKSTEEKLEVVRKKPQYETEELNHFLKKQRKCISQELSDARTMAILSGRGTSSMVAAISYAWILENSIRPNGWTHVPIINFPRRNMWKNEQAAWLFHHSGLDAKALLFSDEVDMDKLAGTKGNKVVTIGNDVFKTNREVASCCTLLVEKYSQDAQSMLKGGILKKLLLAGVLLDTENLDFLSAFCTARDEAAAALLLHGAGPNGRYGFYLQLKRQFYDRAFRTILRETYGEIVERPVTGAMLEEEPKHKDAAGKAPKQVDPDSGTIMAVMKEKKPAGIMALSTRSGLSSSISVSSSTVSRPKPGSSNCSNSVVQHKVSQHGPGGKSIPEADDKAKMAGGWKTMNQSSVRRFFNVFGRTHNAQQGN